MSNAMGLSMGSLMPVVFEELSRLGLRYCLLRGGEAAVATAADVDLLVHPADFPAFETALERLGFVERPAWGRWPHHFYLAYVEADDRWITLDVVTVVAFGRPTKTIRTAFADGCLERRRRASIADVPSPEDELLLLLLHCLVDKAAFADHHRARLAELCQQVAPPTPPPPSAPPPPSEFLVSGFSFLVPPPQPETRNQKPETPWRGGGRGVGSALPGSGRPAMEIDRLLAGALPDGLTWSRLSTMIVEGQWDELLGLRPAVIGRLSGGSGVDRLARKLAGKVLRKLDRVCRRPGLAVALLAPDGAGKTTLTSALAERCPLPVQRVYMGFNTASSTVSLPLSRWLRAAPRRLLRRRHPLVGALDLVADLLEMWFRYAHAAYQRHRGRLVIFDRYGYDALVAPTAGARRSARRWLITNACPPPDLIVFLDVPGEELYRRKGEHDVDWLEQQRQGYLRLASVLPNLVVLDATGEPDEVRRQLSVLVWRCLAGRARSASTSCTEGRIAGSVGVSPAVAPGSGWQDACAPGEDPAVDRERPQESVAPSGSGK